MIMPKEQKVPSQRTYRTQPYSVPMPGPVLSNNTIMPQPLDHQSPPNERASTAWSQDDDSRLAQYRAKGMNWGPIASHFPNKTPNACRKRHERLMEKQKAESWDGVKTEDLARAYLECREAMWKMVADRVGEKWTTVESKVGHSPKP